MQSFFIPHQLPGMNEIIRAAKGGRKGVGRYSDLKARLNLELWAVVKEAKLQRPEWPVRIVFHWREPDKSRDLDNIRAGAKFVLDALVLAKVLDDDGWACVVGLADTFSIVPRVPRGLVGVLVELDDLREK